MPHTVQCCPQRVLVVDDNEDLVDTLATVLGICGHCVVTAPGATVALAKARADRPDVIVCDLAMPDVDGFAFARAIRRDPDLCRTRLIALSAHHHKHDEARAAGFDFFLEKPADLRRLAMLLRPCSNGQEEGVRVLRLADVPATSAALPRPSAACSSLERARCVALGQAGPSES